MTYFENFFFSCGRRSSVADSKKEIPQDKKKNRVFFNSGSNTEGWQVFLVVGSDVRRQVGFNGKASPADSANIRLLARVSTDVCDDGVREGRLVRTPGAEVHRVTAVEGYTTPNSCRFRAPALHGLNKTKRTPDFCQIQILG